jgi:DNA repair protein RecO (recombination protein O)
MPTYRDEAVVIRTHKLGEADRIVTFLSRYHGIVRAVAKGVRRTTSKFGSRLEPFMVVDLQLYEGKNLDTVSQAETIGAYGREISADYPSFTAASAMVETAEKLAGGETLSSPCSFGGRMGSNLQRLCPMWYPRATSQLRTGSRWRCL